MVRRFHAEPSVCLCLNDFSILWMMKWFPPSPRLRSGAAKNSHNPSSVHTYSATPISGCIYIPSSGPGFSLSIRAAFWSSSRRNDLKKSQPPGFKTRKISAHKASRSARRSTCELIMSNTNVTDASGKGSGSVMERTSNRSN